MRSLCNPPGWVQLEYEVAHILQEQEEYGWRFNERAAWELASTLRSELEETQGVLRNRHPFVFGSEFTPKRNNKTQGYVEGCPFTKLKDFSPTSRDHIAWILTTHYSWTPELLTATGKAIIDETTLSKIDNDFARGCLRILDLTKKLGMLAEGQNAWLKLVTSAERIHHHCSISTSTHRAAHRNPNLAQVPSDLAYRALFRASEGMRMVGADLSGIELRMLGSYLSKYDGGAYVDILLNDDIHQVNADKIGISRRLVKTVTYAFLYGAGDEKIGKSYDQSLPTNKAKSKGKEIRSSYVEAIDGLDTLLLNVRKAADRGYIKAIDGRRIPVDSPHKALNYLLQSSAACVAKRWLVIAHPLCKDLLARQLAFVHDELQYECPPEKTEDVKFALELAAVQAGEYYNLRCPIAAEGKIGINWAEVH